jgi:hypothetical protein
MRSTKVSGPVVPSATAITGEGAIRSRIAVRCPSVVIWSYGGETLRWVILFTCTFEYVCNNASQPCAYCLVKARSFERNPLNCAMRASGCSFSSKTECFVQKKDESISRSCSAILEGIGGDYRQ